MSTPLEEVLAGRDARAALQRTLFLKGAPSFLVQICLNVPGFPKRLEGDEAIVAYTAGLLRARIRSVCVNEVSLTNGAGVCAVLVFAGTHEEAEQAKRAASLIEEESERGRLLDLDVLTERGAVSRQSLGMGARTCLICGADAKMCAAASAHDRDVLRAEAERLAALFCGCR